MTLFPDRVLETIEPDACRWAMLEALEHDRPDAVGIVGYARPESMAAARWAARHRRPTILMSESQAIDQPARLVEGADQAAAGPAVRRGRRRRPAHRDYLVQLGMPPDRIALGYNAVDNDYFAEPAESWRGDPAGRVGLARGSLLPGVNRFVPEKNLVRLIEAFARYRRRCAPERAWDLVLCGDGPGEAQVEAAVAASGLADAIHRPGFLQVDELPRWYAHAGAFVQPSLIEPWGLVVNEAAACGLPLLVSDRAGCAETLVPDPPGTTGGRFDPLDVERDRRGARLDGRPCRASRSRPWAVARPRSSSIWGPDRFADGVRRGTGSRPGSPVARIRDSAMPGRRRSEVKR